MIFGILNNLFTSRSQKKAASKINPVREFYQASPYAVDNLNIAKQLFNARMAGAADQERNIMAGQANTLAAINRNATDSAQALALAGQAQGQTNQAFNQLGILEAQNKYGLLGNLNAANAGMTAEKDKVFNDKLAYYNDLSQQKQALLNASQINKANAWNGLDSMIQSAASMFVGGGGSLLGGLQKGGLMGGAAGGVGAGYYGYDPRLGGYNTP